MQIFALLAMQKTHVYPLPGKPITQTITEWQARVLDLPRGTTKYDVLQMMLDEMPEGVRDGAITCFSAERNEF